MGRPKGSKNVDRSGTPDGCKICSACSATKPVEAFYITKSTPDGLGRICKYCQLDATRMVNYRLTFEQWLDMIEAQDFCCASCGDRFATRRDIHVDHDHACCPKPPTCGECVRALLCSACNTGIGFFQDSPVRLRAAIAYLEGFG